MSVECRAAVLHAFGEPHRIEAVELRSPGPGEVRVRVVAAGVCHSDVGQADGEWEFPLPTVLGHEGSGIVEELGPGVTGLAVGQRVVLNLAPGCGGCPHCAVGRPILCQDALDAMGEGRLTTGPTPISGSSGPIATYSLLSCFAEQVVVAAASVIPLPDDVPADVGALIGCAVITGVGAAIHTIEVAAGSRGAVFGVGGVGVNALQAAVARGALVDVYDPSAERQEHARRFGARAADDPADGNVAERLRGAARRDGYDWAIVTVGSGEAIRLAVSAVRPGGTVCVVGLVPQDRPVPIDMLDLVTFETRVVGSAYGSLAPRALVPRIVELYRSGRLNLAELVTSTLPLDAIDEAFALSRGAAGLRPVLAITDEGRFR